MTECELDTLSKEYVSDLMTYGWVNYSDDLDTLKIDFVINRVSEDTEPEVLNSWLALACDYRVLDMGQRVREAVEKKAYEIIFENLSKGV